MEAGNRAIHLELLGLVAWRIGATRTPVVSGRPAEIAVILALHRPGWVSVDALLEELWDEPPRSRSNAVQRHVSRLRRQIGEIADVDPNEVVQWSAAGYRLGDVASTDFEVASGPVRSDLRVLRWEPELGGIDPDRLLVLRHMLSTRVADHRRRWVRDRIDRGEPVEAFEALVDAVPGRTDDALAAELVLEIAEAVDEPAERSAVAEWALEAVDPAVMPAAISSRLRRLAAPTTANPSAFQYAALHTFVTSARDDGFAVALDRLDEIDVTIPADVRRRLVRSLVWNSQTDGFARILLAELAGLPASMQQIAECVFVSFDAFAIEQMPDPIAAADEEVRSAVTIDEVVRALRVRFMVGLGWPTDAEQREVVTRLGAIDHPDAIVESARFEAILAAKSIDPAGALVWLDRQRRAATQHWPDSIDELDVLMRMVLRARWPDLVPEVDRGLLPIESNHGTLEIVRLVELVLDPAEQLHVDRAAEADRSCESMWRTHSVEVASAFDLLTALAAGRRKPASTIAASMADTWLSSPSNRHRHLGLLALGRYAETIGDGSLAASAANALEPWRGEMLGIWPFDVLLGPAAEWIERFRAV